MNIHPIYHKSSYLFWIPSLIVVLLFTMLYLFTTAHNERVQAAEIEVGSLAAGPASNSKIIQQNDLQNLSQTVYIPFASTSGNTLSHRDQDIAPDWSQEEFDAFMAWIQNERIGMRPAVQVAASGPPNQVGSWSAPFDWPVIAMHASLLPDGRVISWDRTFNSSNNQNRQSAIWDPRTGSFERDPVDGNADLFCSGHILLPNGKLFIAGGEVQGQSTVGTVFTHTFDPQTNSWTRDKSMNAGRWYPSISVMPDGELFISGGDPERPEIRQTDGSIRLLNNIDSSLGREYPWHQLAPNGKLLYFGPDYNKLSYIDTAGLGSIQSFGNRDDTNRYYGGYAMFDIGKILVTGGGSYNRTARVIDLNGSSPTVSNTSSMHHERYQLNTTILADGTVFASGGNNVGTTLFDAQTAVYEPEIWDPQTGNWRRMASMFWTRQYHSTALLLPDGRVLSAGGGICGACTAGGYHNLNAEIFSPPYLFDSSGNLALRPAIEQIPNNIKPGTSFTLLTSDADSIQKVALIQLGVATHSVNMTQRYIPLTFSKIGRSQLQVNAPTDFNIAPPGHYMAVILNEQGTPSVAAIVKITNEASGGIATPIPTTAPEPDSTPAPTATPTPTPAQPLSIAPIYAAPFPINAQIDYAAEVTGGSDQKQYYWTFGEGGEVGPQNESTANYSYSSPGRYKVTLRVNDNAGNQAILQFLQEIHLPLTARKPVHSTSILYAAADVTSNNEDRIWTVNPDNNSVSVFSIGGSKIAEIQVGNQPKTLAHAPDNRIWVANRGSATISVIDQSTLQVTQTIELPRGSQPYGLVASPSERAMYVVLEATGLLLKLDPDSGLQLDSVDISPSARHLSIDAQGSKIYVSRYISPPLQGEDRVAVDLQSGGGEIVVIDAQMMSQESTIHLHYSNALDSESSGSGLPNYLGPLVISPDGVSGWVPSKQDNVGRGALRNQSALNFENSVRAITSRIDLATATESEPSRLDMDNASIASAAALNSTGTLLLVTLETVREVSAIDPHNGAELFRFTVERAPQGVVISPDGHYAYIHNFMDRTVTKHLLTDTLSDLSLPVQHVATFQSVASENLPLQILLGKQNFYDARDNRLALDGYMSCASCHADGGHDGRVWDLSSSGEGLRNTISLNGRGGPEHGPLHWTANFDEVHDFELQIRTLAGGNGLMRDEDFAATRDPLGASKAGLSNDLDALAAYVNSLTTVADSPHRAADGSLTPKGAAGRIIFEREGCATCHGGDAYTDSATKVRHDIGTIQEGSGSRLFAPIDGLDTPTLRGLWATSPYLHDGSARTLRNAVERHSSVANSSFLQNEDEMSNLIAFLKQIDDNEPAATINYPPQLTMPPNQQHSVGDTVAITLLASDPEGDSLTFRATDLPDGLTIDADSGQISGTLTKAGINQVTIIAQASNGATNSATLVWSVILPPTSTPTDAPTSTPTYVPTSTPTDVPTSTPTDVPTSTPTDAPTSTATDVPTSTATDVPTSTATDVPTTAATDVPTTAATDVPTTAATDIPTTVPAITSTAALISTSEPTDTPYAINTPTKVIISDETVQKATPSPTSNEDDEIEENSVREDKEIDEGDATIQAEKKLLYMPLIQ